VIISINVGRPLPTIGFIVYYLQQKVDKEWVIALKLPTKRVVLSGQKFSLKENTSPIVPLAGDERGYNATR